MEISYHYDIWPCVINILKMNNAGVSSRTGCHFHVDKRGLSSEIVTSIYDYINNYTNRSYLISLSGREPNKYCKFKNDMKTHRRNRAINLLPKTTFELRFFSSTLDVAVFITYLEFIKKLIITYIK